MTSFPCILKDKSNSDSDNRKQEIPARKFSLPRSEGRAPWHGKFSQLPQRPGFPMKLQIKGCMNQEQLVLKLKTMSKVNDPPSPVRGKPGKVVTRWDNTK